MKQLSLILFIHLLLIPVCPQISYSATYTIFMHAGGTVEASHYVIEGDNLKVFLKTPQDAFIVFPRAYVDKIVKEEEEEKKEVVENKLELCDVVGCAANYRRCCENLNNWTKRMKSGCDRVDNSRKKSDKNQDYYANECEKYKKKVSFWEAECPSCAIVSSCCGWNWD
jgi:hypothetical protein